MAFQIATEEDLCAFRKRHPNLTAAEMLPFFRFKPELEKPARYLLNLQDPTAFSRGLADVEWCPPDDDSIREMAKGIFVYKEGHVVPNNIVRARIDSSVKSIPNKAFKDCQLLKEVEFSKGLEKIGNGAFDGCLSLICIRTPSTTRVIGQRAFHGCTSLMTVSFNEGLEEIEGYAFDACLMLGDVSLPSTTKRLGTCAFSKCEQLKLVALNEGLNQVGDRVFEGCPVRLRLIGSSQSVGLVKDTSRPNNPDYHWEVEPSIKVWKQIAIKEESDSGSDGYNIETVEQMTEDSMHELEDELEVERLKAENKKLRKKTEELLAEKHSLKKSLAGMKRKFQETGSELEKISKKFNGADEDGGNNNHEGHQEDDDDSE